MKLSKEKLLKLKKKSKYRKVRVTIKGTNERPRLSVYRSNEHIYAQIIDDLNSITLISCSTLERSIKKSIVTGKTCDAARIVGERLAKLSFKKNIKKVIFDRGSYIYHGRIKALAEGARSGGLQF